MELVYQKKISEENFNEKSTTYNNEDDTEKKKELEKDFFNIWIANQGNLLSAEVVKAPTLAILKSKLNIVLKEYE